MILNLRGISSLILTVVVVVVCVLLSGTALGERRLVDPLGRVVTVPDNPVRIVALAPSVTEMIFDLNQQHRLVGATRFSNYPPAAKKLPRIGSYVRMDLERIVALQPDLCIGVRDGNPIAIVRRLADLGIPVYAVDPRNVTAVMETLKALGELLDARREADAILEEMQNRLNRIHRKVQNTASKPRVFLQIGVTPMVSVGPNTLADEMITLAGGVNVIRGKASYPVLSREQILGLAPEVYIITSMSRDKAFDRLREEWQQWPQMPAVRNSRIHLINSDLTDRPSPRLVEGLECIAAAIHPDLWDFEKMNCQ